MFIELSGTPSSGKNTIIEGLYQSGQYDNFEVIDESFPKCPLDDANFELGVLWTIFDTHSEVNRVLSRKSSLNPGLIIFNRGLFDRIAFARLLRYENKHYGHVADHLEKWLQRDNLLRQLDLIFIVLTSYEKAKTRKLEFKLRPNSTLRIVNPRVVEKLNEIYLSLFAELKNELPLVLIDDLVHDLSVDQKISAVNNQIHKIRFSRK